MNQLFFKYKNEECISSAEPVVVDGTTHYYKVICHDVEIAITPLLHRYMGLQWVEVDSGEETELSSTAGQAIEKASFNKLQELSGHSH